MKDKAKSESPLIGERSAEEILERVMCKESRGDSVAYYIEQGAILEAMEIYASQFKAKEESLPEATAEPNNKNMSDVEFYTKNLLACVHNLIGVIENKQWERLDKKTWALKDACTKLKIHSQVESKEDNKAFGEWISVDERLPELDKGVLVFDTGDYYEAYYSKKLKKWIPVLDLINTISVTHWRPLPSPPCKPE